MADFIQSAQKRFGEFFSEAFTMRLNGESDKNVMIMDVVRPDSQVANLDLLTMAPNTLIAENIFIVVSGRANLRKIVDFLTRLTSISNDSNSGFSFRNSHLFGRLILVVKKSKTHVNAETISRAIKRYNMLSIKIKKYFDKSLEVIVLPVLQWTYYNRPDFQRDDFYLNYNHIKSAQQESYRKMMAGLARITEVIIESAINDHSFECDNLASRLSNLNRRAGSKFDIGQLDHEWSQDKAKIQLHNHFSMFDFAQVGLGDLVLQQVCPEINHDLFNCLENFIKESCRLLTLRVWSTKKNSPKLIKLLGWRIKACHPLNSSDDDLPYN